MNVKRPGNRMDEFKILKTLNFEQNMGDIN